MKVYRLFKGFGPDGHQGFEFFVRKRDAEKALRDLKAEAKEGPDWKDSIGGADVETLELPEKKDEIVAFLNQYAAHPDNG